MISFIKRVGLLIASSFAIMVTLGILVSIVQYLFGIHIDNSSIISLGLLSLVLGFGSAMIGLWTSRRTAKKTYKIQLFDSTISDHKLQLVYDTVSQIAHQHNITMPEVGYYTSTEVNAFATGPSKDSALVAVSTGLVRQMDDDAIRGVIGHEMTHVLNGDMVTTTLLQGILNTLVVFLARMLAGLISGAHNDEGSSSNTGSYYIISNILDMIFGFGVSLIVMRHSRVREFAADAGSVKLLGSKKPMLDGLYALQHIHEPANTVHKDPLDTLKISGGLSGMFASHPSLEARIAAVQQLS